MVLILILTQHETFVPESSKLSLFFFFLTVSYQLKLKTEVDLEISGSKIPERLEVADTKDDGELETVLFTQTFQVRKYLSSPIQGVLTRVRFKGFILVFKDKSRTEFGADFSRLCGNSVTPLVGCNNLLQCQCQTPKGE